MQIREHEVLLEIVCQSGDSGVPARYLQRHRGHGGWQQTFEAPGTPLRLGERRPFIEARIVQQTVAPRMLLPRCGHLDGSLRGHLACPILSRSGPISEPNAFKRQPNDGKEDANSVRIWGKAKASSAPKLRRRNAASRPLQR